MRQTREELKLESRPKRVPVNEANRNKLVIAGLDHQNFYYRWVNNVEDRLMTFLNAGYEFVDKTGAPIGDGGVENSTGADSRYSKGVGMGVVAYLMRIPRDLWEQDQKVKDSELRKLEADMKRSAKEQYTGNLDVGNGKASGPFRQGGA